MGVFSLGLSLLPYLFSPWLVLLLLGASFYYFCIRQVSPNPLTSDPSTFPTTPDLELDNEVRKAVLRQAYSKSKIDKEHFDVIVIGSGIGGLSTAALLAKAGKKVLVLEQHDRAGGSCHTFNEEGYEFDVGIHYIGEIHKATKESRIILDQIAEGNIHWNKLDPNYDTVVLGRGNEERQYGMIEGFENYKASILKHFPDEEEAVEKFVQIMRRSKNGFLWIMLLKMLPMWLAKLLASWSNYIPPMRKFFQFARQTTQQVVEELTDNKDLQAVFMYSFGDYGTAPSDSSIIMQALLLRHFMNGGSYPVGGSSEIAYQIIKVIEKLKGKVLVRAAVGRILVDSAYNEVIGVEMERDKTRIFAETVISSAGLFNTYEKLLRNHTHVLVEEEKRLQNVRHGLGCMVCFVGLKGTSEELALPARNYWVFENNDLDGTMKEWLAREDCGDGAENVPLMFVSFNSAKDPSFNTRCPDKSSCELVTLLPYEWFSEWQDEPVQKRSHEYRARKEQIAFAMKQRLLELFPQLADKIDYFDSSSPITINHYLGASRGEIYGIDHDLKRFSDPETIVRLRADYTSIKGLFFTGQDTFTCGFSGALMGGVLAASAVLKRNIFIDVLKLQKQINRSRSKKNE